MRARPYVRASVRPYGPEHACGPAGGGRGGDGRAAARDPARDRHQHERAGRTRRVLAGLYLSLSHLRLTRFARP